MNKIFVYGTLRNERLEKVIPGVAKFVQPDAKGFVKGKLFDTGDYPAAKPARLMDAKVYGEIIQIDNSNLTTVLGMLDEYEEIDGNDPEKSLFKRKTVMVNLEGGKKTKAWIYWYNKDVKGLKEIKDGVYRKRKTPIA